MIRISAEWTVAECKQEVICEQVLHADLDILSARSVEQNILKKSGDTLCIDWGTVYCALPSGVAETAINDATVLREVFANTGKLLSDEKYILPRPANSFGGPALAVAFTAAVLPESSEQFHVTLAYDDQYSIEYLGEFLRPWWRRDGRQHAVGMLSAAHEEYIPLMKRCDEFDQHLIDEATQSGGEHYAQLISLAGRLAHNANLSIKAIIALACYGKIAGQRGLDDIEQKYALLATDYAKQWVEKACDNGHTRLTFNTPGTWSMKYNLAWDNLLGLNLFPPDTARNELAWYLKIQNKYGIPLDSRRDFTKPDWIMWCAALAEDDETFRKLIDPVYQYAHRTPSRVPLSDWYDTITGARMGTKARSVVGGFFMKLLKDRLEKYR